ncbi:MAG: radical SAM protein [Acidobacteriota bacterium]
MPAGPSCDIAGGRIRTWSLEIHAVDHCNLRCASCCTLSPRLGRRATPAPELARDLAAARAALAPHVVKLTGGEPLLHPGICELVATVRASGLGEQVGITTNGFAVDRVSHELFALLDRLTLSLYPSAPLPAPKRRAIEEACARHGVLVTVKECGSFQQMAPSRPHDDAATARIHADCWLRVRCHLLHRGRFYACTRPPHLEDAGHVPRGTADQDGVELEGPDLAARLKAYLEREDPLASCRACLGAAGPWEPHRQEPRVTPRGRAPRRDAGSGASPSSGAARAR